MIKLKTIVLIALFLSSFSHTNAQTEKGLVSLTSFLDKVSEKFGCNFSYINQELEDIFIPDLSQLTSVENSISYLESKTSFQYTILTDKTITINSTETHLSPCGILIDQLGNPISDATIQTTSQSVTSNDLGVFTLAPTNIDDIITIQYLGFSPKKISVKELIQKPCLKITLHPEIESLNEVILNNYLIKGITKQLDGSIRIDYNNFGILPGLIEPDLLQTIQALPGILSTNETISDINVRGGTNDQNLILWDGIKMYQSGHFFGLISAFNPYLTKNVEVYKNGSSATYGDGVSSVIAMNTSNTINNSMTSSIGVNLISTDGYIDTPIGQKSSLQVAIRRSVNEVLKTPTYNRYFDKAFQNSEVINDSNSDAQFSFYDASIRWLYQLSPKDLIKVNVITMHNNLVFQENSLIDDVAITKESNVSQDNIAGGVMYQRKWNTKFRSNILLYGTNYRLEAVNSDIENNQRLLQENDVLENGIKINTTITNETNFSLKSGYQFNETGISNLQDINNPTFRDLTKEVIRTHSLYSELEYKTNSNNSVINLGLRLNHFDKFNKNTVEPRISFVNRFPNHFSLEVLGEIKSQTTSQIIDLQNDFLGIENRRWVLSNDDNVPIIKSKQLSVGINYNHYNWLISGDLYYKNVDGIITKSQGFQNQYESINDHGSYTVSGIELLVNKRFKNISTWLSYSHSHNDYTFNNLSTTKFSNNIDIRNNINFVIAYNFGKMKFSGGINWHSGKPTTKPATNNLIENTKIDYLPANTSTIEDYIRADISATYDFYITKNIKGLTGISIWNLFNEKNVSNEYYKVSDQNKIENVSESGLGFTPNIIFRVKF